MRSFSRVGTISLGKAKGFEALGSRLQGCYQGPSHFALHRAAVQFEFAHISGPQSWLPGSRTLPLFGLRAPGFLEKFTCCVELPLFRHQWSLKGSGGPREGSLCKLFKTASPGSSGGPREANPPEPSSSIPKYPGASSPGLKANQRKN